MVRPRHNISLFVIDFDTTSVPTRSESRMIVERTLSKFLGEKATLTYDEFGKPSLLGKDSPSISYAHSKTCVVIALDYSSEAIGIDTEPKKRLEEIIELKEPAFSDYELKNLNKKDYLFSWCIKEAAVKQLGTGFRNADPSQFSIEINGKSYKISLDNNPIFQGYFLDISLDENHIVVCSNRPIKEFLLTKQSLDNSK